MGLREIHIFRTPIEYLADDEKHQAEPMEKAYRPTLLYCVLGPIKASVCIRSGECLHLQVCPLRV
jgi:hypothetical protein